MRLVTCITVSGIALIIALWFDRYLFQFLDVVSYNSACMKEANNTKTISTNEFRISVVIILAVSLLLGITYCLITASNLFGTTFIEDDWFFIERAGMIKDNPFSFFTLTFSGFYRPLGYNLPSIIFLMVGLNPLFFHVLDLCVHLLTGALLFLLARKMFDPITGVLAFILYITFPSIVISVGFSSSLFQDELSTLFFILTLLFLYRANPEPQRSKNYLVPALFLFIGALCKESWLGLIPAIILMDWVNYKKASFKERLQRLWVFSLPIITLIAKFVFADMSRMQSGFARLVGENLNIQNVIYGLSLPFLPWEIFEDTSIFNFMRLIAPLIFIILPLFLIKAHRFKITVIIVAFMGLFLSQLAASLNNYLFGWAHLFPLLAFGSILIASTLRGIAIKLKDSPVFWIIAVIAVTGFIRASYPTTEMLSNLVKELSHEQQVKYSGFRQIIRGFPDDANIYSFSGPNYYVAREAFIKPSMDFCQIAPGKKENREVRGLIAGTPIFLKTKLKLVGDQPNFKAISYQNNKWVDKTAELRDWLNQDVPFPIATFLGEH